MPVLHLPTQEACEAYGIPRRGTRARKDDKTKFMSGPQFKNLSINQSTSQVIGSHLDEIHIEFIGNNPYNLTFETKDNIQHAAFKGSGPEPESILDMFIAPNTTEWVNFTSSHVWEKPGGIITSLFESVTSLLSAGNGILSKILNVTNTGGLQAEQQIVFDQADAYTSSSAIEFSVPFLLWSAGATVDDWIRDIYLPIMLLTAWSYPRRAAKLTTEQTLEALGAASKQAAEAAQKDGEDVTKTIQDTINKIYPGARITILDPPSYLRVKHTSGLFNFNRCAIKSFNFRYMDPWVKASTGDGNLNSLSETLLSRSLPMRAECNLTLQSIEKLYADDWISMYDRGLKDLGVSQSKVNVNIIKANQVAKPPSSTQR